MKRLPPIIPVKEIPETFENYMSPIEWLAKPTHAYICMCATAWSIKYLEDSNTLVIREKRCDCDE